MMHLDEGTLQALLDGELPPRERGPAEAHLGACAGCAAALGELRAANGLFAAALARADVAAPVAQAQMALRRRRHAAAAAPSGWRVARTHLLRAALLVLGLAGVAAAAVPGSPVRALLEEVLAPEAAPPPPPAPAPRAAAPAPPRQAPLKGVFVELEDGAMRVVLSRPARGTTVKVRLTDDTRAEVYAYDQAATGTFDYAAGRIELEEAGPGEVRVALPRSARAAFVEVDGRVHVAKDGDRLRGIDPAVDPSDAGMVFRVQR